MQLNTSMPELRHLRCFVTVAETLNFTEAAQRLGIAQPSLTQQIQRLERQLGYPLFDRGRAGRSRIALTEVGQTFLPDARRALLAAENSMHDARRCGAGMSGQLRIGFVSSCAASVLAPLISRFRMANPNVQLVLRECTTGQQVDELLAGQLDVALGRDVEVYSGDFASIYLDSDEIMAVIPKNHRLSKHKKISMRSLADEDFIFFPEARGAAFYRRMVAPCLRAGFKPRVVQETAEWLTLMALVSAGLGVSLVPRRVCANVPRAAVARPIDDPLAVTAISLWWIDGNEKASLSHFRQLAQQWADRNRGGAKTIRHPV